MTILSNRTRLRRKGVPMAPAYHRKSNPPPVWRILPSEHEVRQAKARAKLVLHQLPWHC